MAAPHVVDADGAGAGSNAPGAAGLGGLTAPRRFPSVEGYEVRERLGETTASDVYLAAHMASGALRTLAVQRAESDPAAVRRIVREVLEASRVKHPGIALVDGVGTTRDGLLYVATAYVAGTTLAAVLAEEGHLPARRAAQIARRAADALDAAHRQNVMHGDLTPEHIILGAAGADGVEPVTVSGFGMAASRSGAATPVAPPKQERPYASPERVSGNAPDARSDVFSLASVLMHALSGNAPPPPRASTGRGNTPTSMAAIDPKARLAPTQVVLVARAAEPERRYQTMGAFGDAIARAFGDADDTRRTPDSARAVATALATPIVVAAAATTAAPAEPRPRDAEPALASPVAPPVAPTVAPAAPTSPMREELVAALASGVPAAPAAPMAPAHAAPAAFAPAEFAAPVVPAAGPATEVPGVSTQYEWPLAVPRTPSGSTPTIMVTSAPAARPMRNTPRHTPAGESPFARLVNGATPTPQSVPTTVADAAPALLGAAEAGAAAPGNRRQMMIGAAAAGVLLLSVVAWRAMAGAGAPAAAPPAATSSATVPAAPGATLGSMLAQAAGPTATASGAAPIADVATTDASTPAPVSAVRPLAPAAGKVAAPTSEPTETAAVADEPTLPRLNVPEVGVGVESPEGAGAAQHALSELVGTTRVGDVDSVERLGNRPVVDAQTRAEIGTAVSRFARAIEARDIDQLRRAYPGLTASERNTWSSFFRNTDWVRARFSAQDIQFIDAGLDVNVVGSLTFTKRDTGQKLENAITFRVLLRRVANGWVMKSIH